MKEAMLDLSLAWWKATTEWRQEAGILGVGKRNSQQIGQDQLAIFVEILFHNCEKSPVSTDQDVRKVN